MLTTSSMVHSKLLTRFASSFIWPESLPTLKDFPQGKFADQDIVLYYMDLRSKTPSINHLTRDGLKVFISEEQMNSIPDPRHCIVWIESSSTKIYRLHSQAETADSSILKSSDFSDLNSISNQSPLPYPQSSSYLLIGKGPLSLKPGNSIWNQPSNNDSSRTNSPLQSRSKAETEPLPSPFTDPRSDNQGRHIRNIQIRPVLKKSGIPSGHEILDSPELLTHSHNASLLYRISSRSGTPRRSAGTSVGRAEDQPNKVLKSNSPSLINSRGKKCIKFDDSVFQRAEPPSQDLEGPPAKQSFFQAVKKPPVGTRPSYN